jgi:hypothetical protein
MVGSVLWVTLNVHFSIYMMPSLLGEANECEPN